MSTNFMYDFLPSFYRDFMVDKNGVSVLDPLFTIYSNCIGNALYESQQLSLVPYLEKTPIVIKEFFKTIDIRSSNLVGTRQYKIDKKIIGFSDLFYDANFTIPVTPSFFINYDEANKIQYIEFDTDLEILENTIYAKYCYRNENILRDTFGRLLNYQPVFPFREYDINFIEEQERYRQELLAILYCSMNGQTFNTISKSLSMFLGLKYAPFNAIVRDNSGGSITLENIDDGNLETIYGNIKSSINVGDVLNKYDILETDFFTLFDIYTDPARFTQCILASYSEHLLSLLNIDISNEEQYATLFYDSLVTFDENNIYWDMGNNTGVSHNIPEGATYYSDPNSGTINNFSSYTDSRFDSQKLYEMFRNVFILDFMDHQDDATMSKVSLFLDRFKPIYTKYIIYNPINAIG